MDDDLIDVEATKRVANRALGSAFLAFFGAIGARILPGLYLPIPFFLIAIVVGISATLTLNHPEARVIGGLRHLGIVLAILGVVAGAFGLIATVLLLTGVGAR